MGIFEIFIIITLLGIFIVFGGVISFFVIGTSTAETIVLIGFAIVALGLFAILIDEIIS